jgi:hypothetical protein
MVRSLPLTFVHDPTQEDYLRRLAFAASLAAAVSLTACQKTGDGEFKVKTPDVDVNVSADTTTVRTPTVDVGSKTDTINTPVIGTTKDTIVVDRPTAGTKQTEVKVPTVDVKRP